MKRIISLFTFGVFLIVAGAVGMLFNWSQSNLIMSVGLVFELLAALLFIWTKIKPK